MTNQCGGCREFIELSRRQFMAASAVAGVGAALVAPAWMPRLALARNFSSAQRDVVIAIYLRGGFDGLSAVIPYEQAYINARPNIAVPRHDDLSRPLAERCLFLDSPSNGVSFGLNPNLGALMQAYTDGKLCIVHASGSTDTSRSHFDAQKNMEIGMVPDPNVYTGWLGRHLYSAPPMSPTALLRGIGIAGGLQRSMVGGPLSLPITNLASFGLSGSSGTANARKTALNDMYGAYSDPLRTVGLNTVQTINLLAGINAGAYVPSNGAVYPSNSFGTALKQTAAVVKAQVGVEAVAIDLGSWDDHTNEGPVTVNGSGPTAMATRLQTLAGGLGAFYTDMLAAPASVTYLAVAMSEFGRRLGQNGNLGVDHGWANAMFLMGQAVAGGRVLANWPGMGPGALFQGLDLAVTIDYRDILAEVISERLGNASSLGYVFPGYSPVIRGVLN